jgi:hypothetical protein
LALRDREIRFHQPSTQIGRDVLAHEHRVARDSGMIKSIRPAASSTRPLTG